MLVWDEAGARYYETGVSKGIYFPINGGPGVPWNGLVSAAVDSTGGEPESYYFDGLKYMDRVLAEDFQGTLQVLNVPKEFEKCEGTRPLNGSFGGKTHFNKRDKFNMAWRTEVGNDQGIVAYKIHIAYNCLVQPSGRTYQTLSDNTQMDLRTLTLTSTPACGRHSYFSFDSREGDLSLLEAQLYSGVLPKCWELGALTGAPPGGGGGDGDTPDPDFGCDVIVEDFEAYAHGQLVDVNDTSVPLHDKIILGVINNGLDIIELPAVGAFAANDSAASEVGTSGVLLSDDDDATYITSADGDLGYTVGLPPLVGYVEGATLELHIRASISGGVNPDDPDTLDADMQVHISTDDTGDTTIGGFSDGTDEGMGFSLTVVDGTPVDYVVPLYMDSWVDSPLQDVVDALTAGAYLNVVGATNNNTDTTPEVRVYEMSVVMLNDTDADKWLRTTAPDEEGYIENHVYSSGTENEVVSNSVYVDFKLLEVANVSGGDDHTDLISWSHLDDEPALVQLQMYSDGPYLEWYSGTGGTEWAYVKVDVNKWYRVHVRWGVDSIRIVAFDRELDDVESSYIIDDTRPTTIDPVASAKSFVGMATHGTSTVEVGIDNSIIQIHCHDEGTTDPPADWTCFDLSTAVFFSSTEDGQMEGQYNSGTGRIQSKVDSGSTVRNAQFHMPGFVLDPAKTYEIRATYAENTFGFGIYQQNPSWESTFWSDNQELASMFDFGGRTVFIATVGPGIDDWDAAITAGYQTLIRFDTQTNGDTGAVGGADLISLCYREV